MSALYPLLVNFVSFTLLVVTLLRLISPTDFVALLNNKNKLHFQVFEYYLLLRL